MVKPKLSGFFVSVDDTVNLYRYDNGWMLEVSGRDSEDEWPTKKIICEDLSQVLTLLEEYSKIKLS